MDRAALLRLLSGGAWVSGQRLAEALGVSRAAVSKQVAALRREGCELRALPRLGYRLVSVPSPLSAQAIRSLLSEHPWAQSVTVLPCVDSTNNWLKRAAAEGAPHGTIVIADSQTGGRGRRGRSFDSAAGAGLYLSALLRPRCAPAELLTLTAQTAVAARRTLQTVCGCEADIKWVNDLQIKGKKICGILTELTLEAESGLVDCAVIGVGINCTRMDFPEPLQAIAGSVLSQTGIAPDRNALAAELIKNLSALPPEGWLSEYRAACVTLGRRVKVQTREGERAGTAENVGEQAELIVRFETGGTCAVNSGEAVVLS